MASVQWTVAECPLPLFWFAGHAAVQITSSWRRKASWQSFGERKKNLVRRGAKDLRHFGNVTKTHRDLAILSFSFKSDRLRSQLIVDLLLDALNVRCICRAAPRAFRLHVFFLSILVVLYTAQCSNIPQHSLQPASEVHMCVCPYAAVNSCSSICIIR